MKFLRYIRAREIRLAAEALLILLLLGVLVSLVAAVELMPGQSGLVIGSTLDLRGAAAAEKGWPSTTPHEIEWPVPNYWIRTTRPGLTMIDVRAPVSGNIESQFVMNVVYAGWPLRVIEHKTMWWDLRKPELEGVVSNPAPTVLYNRLALNTLLLGGGLWLIIFGPLGLFVVGRRVVWTLQGHCTFCGYDMTGFEQCPECGWRAKGSTPASSEVSSG
jgi:rRNA maturation protein Nop10